jgi:hypothetical protein
MIFLVIEDHPLASLIKSDRKTEMWSADNDEKGLSYKQINEENRYLSTMLKPFNIGLFYKTEVSFTDNSNEYEYSTGYKTGFDEMAHLVISGVEIISEGMVTSVNDMVTEISMQFVAHDVFNIEKQEEGKSVYNTEAKSKETARKEKEVSVASSVDEKVIASTDTEKKARDFIEDLGLSDLSSIRDKQPKDVFPTLKEWEDSMKSYFERRR